MSGSELEYRVRFSDTDWMGLLHHAHYPRLFEWAREEFFRSVGHAWLDHIHEDRWLAVLEVEYRVVGRARYDDVLHIHTTLTQVSRARIWLEYEVRAADAGEVVATGRTLHAILDGQGKVLRVPPGLAEHIEAEPRKAEIRRE